MEQTRSVPTGSKTLKEGSKGNGTSLSLTGWGTEWDTEPVCFTQIPGHVASKETSLLPVDRESPQKQDLALDTKLSGGGGGRPVPNRSQMAQGGGP